MSGYSACKASNVCIEGLSTSTRCESVAIEEYIARMVTDDVRSIKYTRVATIPMFTLLSTSLKEFLSTYVPGR